MHVIDLGRRWQCVVSMSLCCYARLDSLLEIMPSMTSLSHVTPTTGELWRIITTWENVLKIIHVFRDASVDSATGKKVNRMLDLHHYIVTV